MRLVPNSKYTAIRAEWVYGIRPEVVYPPVDLDGIPFTASGAREPSAVTVARFSREKRIEIAVRAVPRISGLRRLFMCGAL